MTDKSTLHDASVRYEGDCPYRGLWPFDVEHAPFFCGREALTARLLDAMRLFASSGRGHSQESRPKDALTSRLGCRLVAIVGEAGCGKSSLARAGLLGALKRGEIEGSAAWPVVVCRPGARPVENLAVALSQVAPGTTELGRLREDAHALHEAVRLALADAPPAARLVVLVDQFEEALVLCRDEASRRAWIDNLLYAVSVPQGQTIVVLTLQADFYGQCAAYPELAAALSDHHVLVGPLADSELRRAIEQPARLAGGEFEAGLVATLLHDMNESNVSLKGVPLVWHTLWELWQQRKGRRLTRAAYDIVGGLSGALEWRAEKVYNSFEGVDKELCRQILLWLTAQASHHRANVQELVAIPGVEKERLDRVLQRLAAQDARLLVLAEEADGRRPFVELSHAVLVQSWPRLWRWIEGERESRRMHRQLAQVAQQWEQHERDESYLYGSGWLEVMSEWADGHADELASLEREFLQASQRTEREAMERTRHYESLRELDRLKTRFVANMSHELRTPLNSIIGFSRVILKGIDGPLTEMQKQDLEVIHNSGAHLLGLVNDIVDIFKLEVDKVELSLEEVDFKETIKGVMSTAVGLVRDKPIKLHQLIPEDLPTVWADETRSRQVLLHLITNAAKFTEQGSITVEAAADERFVHVSVRDTGVGIPADKLEALFETFSQVDTSPRRKSGGSGMGLAISKRFVEMHGGQIGVESKPGVGTTFRFTLPRAHPAESVSKTIETQTGLEPGKRIILVIDDDNSVAAMYWRYLERHGYGVIGVANSQKALESARRLKPYAILLDVLMPGQDGWAVLAELKRDEETRSIPVIIASILNERNKAYSLGAVDYLVKPVIEEDLLTALRRLEDRTTTKVLIIDDRPEDTQLIRRMLEAHPRFAISEARSGQEGLEAVRAAAPDLILLDLMMPEMDGFEVLQSLKGDQATRDIPIVIITAKTLTQADLAKLDVNIQALLFKGQLAERDLPADIANALKRKAE
ncbi:MAG: response regulator [Thermoflexales bacterium]|nr:response regulator [Thermoflexales bacterium]